MPDASIPLYLKVIVLGFDGMDYAFTKELIAEGRLPNLARLAEQGSFNPLQTAVPPESPVAWSNFTTGMDAGGHGIFDFLHRDPKTLLPFAADREIGPEGLSITLGKYHFTLTGGDFVSLRHGKPFWAVLEENDIESCPTRRKPGSRELSSVRTDRAHCLRGSNQRSEARRALHHPRP